MRTSLKDYRKIRRVHGGTVNDVILATLSGAIRAWFMTRAESVAAGRRLRALVPMSVIDEELEPTSLGSQVVGHLVDLPIGEGSPVVRLHQVSYALRVHSETGRAVAADRIAGVAGFAPTTFHALGSRVAFEEAGGSVNLVITNVPGPQFPMYLAGAEMVETYPVPPLLPGFSLSVGVTSYDGAVYYGISADRDALPDIEVLGQCVREALDELVDSASDSRLRAPRGRKRTPTPGAGRMTVRIYVPATLTMLGAVRRRRRRRPRAGPGARRHGLAARGVARGRRGGVGVRRPDGRRRRLRRAADRRRPAATGGPGRRRGLRGGARRLQPGRGRLGVPVLAGQGGARRQRGPRAAAAYDPDEQGDLGWYAVQEIPDLLA